MLRALLGMYFTCADSTAITHLTLSSGECLLLFLVSIMGRVDRCGEGGQHCTQYPTVPYTFLCTHIYLLCIYRLYFLLFLDKSYNPHPLCLVVNYMPPGFSPVVISHGNSKSMEPYFPTHPSTSEDIEEMCWLWPKRSNFKH